MNQRPTDVLCEQEIIELSYHGYVPDQQLGSGISPLLGVDSWQNRTFLCNATGAKILTCVNSSQNKLFSFPFKVAVKIIKLQEIGELHRKKLLSIVKMLKSFSNLPNTITLYEMFVCGERVYLVEEYAIGGCFDVTLTQIFKQTQTGLNEIKAREIFRQITNGVTYLHQNNIVHRKLTLKEVYEIDEVVKLGGFHHFQSSNHNHENIYDLGLILYQLICGKSMTSSKPYLPNHISAACASLLGDLLTNKIFEISKILQHPWFKLSSREARSDRTFIRDFTANRNSSDCSSKIISELSATHHITDNKTVNISLRSNRSEEVVTEEHLLRVYKKLPTTDNLLLSSSHQLSSSMLVRNPHHVLSRGGSSHIVFSVEQNGVKSNDKFFIIKSICDEKTTQNSYHQSTILHNNKKLSSTKDKFHGKFSLTKGNAHESLSPTKDKLHGRSRLTKDSSQRSFSSSKDKPHRSFSLTKDNLHVNFSVETCLSTCCSDEILCENTTTCRISQQSIRKQQKICSNKSPQLPTINEHDDVIDDDISIYRFSCSRHIFEKLSETTLNSVSGNHASSASNHSSLVSEGCIEKKIMDATSQTSGSTFIINTASERASNHLSLVSSGCNDDDQNKKPATLDAMSQTSETIFVINPVSERAFTLSSLISSGCNENKKVDAMSQTSEVIKPLSGKASKHSSLISGGCIEDGQNKKPARVDATSQTFSLALTEAFAQNDKKSNSPKENDRVDDKKKHEVDDVINMRDVIDSLSFTLCRHNVKDVPHCLPVKGCKAGATGDDVIALDELTSLSQEHLKPLQNEIVEKLQRLHGWDAIPGKGLSCDFSLRRHVLADDNEADKLSSGCKLADVIDKQKVDESNTKDIQHQDSDEICVGDSDQMFESKFRHILPFSTIQQTVKIPKSKQVVNAATRLQCWKDLNQTGHFPGRGNSEEPLKPLQKELIEKLILIGSQEIPQKDENQSKQKLINETRNSDISLLLDEISYENIQEVKQENVEITAGQQSNGASKSNQTKHQQPINEKLVNKQSINKQSINKQSVNKQSLNEQLANKQSIKKQSINRQSIARIKSIYAASDSDVTRHFHGEQQVDRGGRMDARDEYGSWRSKVKKKIDEEPCSITSADCDYLSSCISLHLTSNKQVFNFQLPTQQQPIRNNSPEEVRRSKRYEKRPDSGRKDAIRRNDAMGKKDAKWRKMVPCFSKE